MDGYVHCIAETIFGGLEHHAATGRWDGFRPPTVPTNLSGNRWERALRLYWEWVEMFRRAIETPVIPAQREVVP